MEGHTWHAVLIKYLYLEIRLFPRTLAPQATVIDQPPTEYHNPSILKLLNSQIVALEIRIQVVDDVLIHQFNLSF